jgi:hypothetical protein
VTTTSSTLSSDLAVALVDGDAALSALAGAEPVDRRDRFLALHQIHDLHRAPVHELGDRVRWQHHPAVADLKGRLEAAWLEELERGPAPTAAGGAAAAMTAMAAHDRAPAVYRWIADSAPWEPALRFLALEGGPDDLFDDLVATCQVGLPLGPAKMELARNYWDEMGNGRLENVHNVLYQRFVDAVELPRIPRDLQPVEALERSALLGLVATNRALQPEMLGVLGLIELEAGPHCRYVEQGLERLGAPRAARDFYDMHATIDPLHGRGWLEHAVGPLVEALPAWESRILRGAAWRSATNEAFFGWAQRSLIHDAAA